MLVMLPDISMTHQANMKKECMNSFPKQAERIEGLHMPHCPLL